MRTKRMLAFMLAFCMIFSVLAAPVSAATQSELKAELMNAEPVNLDNFILSGDQSEGTLKLKKDESKVEWEIKSAEGKPAISLLPQKTPECLQELAKAAELYKVEDIVYAFVVMEGKPLAETHGSRTLVTASAQKQLLQKQDAVISSIEKTVLKGEKLEVRYQFTYLTNSFTIKTAFGNLAEIARMDGVKSVFLTPVYEPMTTANPDTAAAGAMTGVHTVWEELGYTGTGMKIAIIDTGLDLDHPSFAADPELGKSSMTAKDIASVLVDLNAYACDNTITATDLYRSAKVPFAFNYVDCNLVADHSQDDEGDHGTHVAGIAAANHLENTDVVGMAPDAQIIVMKVFGANGGAYMDDVTAALEDAMTLGCDVVNASLGIPAGFSTSDTEMDLIYERLASQDIVATFSAGNEGTSSEENMWGTDMNRTQHPDNATVGAPGIWPNIMTIASAENCEIRKPFFTLADGTSIFYIDTYQRAIGMMVGMESLAGQELEYFFIDGPGSAEDYYDEDGNSLVDGKVAVVSRGEISFGEKILNAQLAGAVACVVYNNTLEDIFYMNVELKDAQGNPFYPSIPGCMIKYTDADVMYNAESSTMTVSESLGAQLVEGGQMSSFSSWGATPDLKLRPDITGIGGNVYSCVDNGKYDVMSGTSMSAPQLAGVTALVMERLYTIYPDAPDGTIRRLAEAMLMSTADPIISAVSGVEASPRQQGAGLVNAFEATTADTYLTVAGNRPKAELGDNAYGKYTFSFEIHNIGSEDKTYDLGGSLLTEYAVPGYGQYFMYGENIPLSSVLIFDKDSVTVPAGGRANVTVSIELSEEDKAYFAQCWKNGGYVEGYVYLFNEEGQAELNLPFMGFYGDWTAAPVFDTAFWYDNSCWDLSPENGLPEGDEYYHILWSTVGEDDWFLGINPYSGPSVNAEGNIDYDPARNVVSPNEDGYMDGISNIFLSLMRNAKVLSFTYTVDGEVVHQEEITDASKTMYISSYGQVVPFIYSWYGTELYDFTDSEGKVLPDNTKVLLTVDGYLDYGTGGKNTLQFPITVDNAAPELARVYESPQDNGDDYIFFAVAENVAPAAAILMNPDGTRILSSSYTFEDMGNGFYLTGFDISGMGSEFLVAVCDYACNESYYEIAYTADPEGNMPEMDTNQLYAYRLFDDGLNSAHMYGWISATKPAENAYAEITVQSDEALEETVITAAAYAGGKIFAVDSKGYFSMMDPGLWNREVISNLGVAVISMAFDDVTDTMYLLALSGNYIFLCSVDLISGALNPIFNMGNYNYAPWAITFDAEGTMYAIMINSAYLYTMDPVTGESGVVTDAEGNYFVMRDQDGTALMPGPFQQDITYSKADNTIYWAHLQNTAGGITSGMAAVNLTDLSVTYSPYSAQAYDDYNELVTYYPETEAVALLVLEETEYTLPEYSVNWKGACASLGGNIALVFGADLSEDLANDPNAFVRYTYLGKTYDVPVSDAIYNGEFYEFYFRITSVNMTDMVEAQMMVGDLEIGSPYSRSLEDYCVKIIKKNTNPKSVALMKAMLNYGAAAQVLNNYKTDTLANRYLDDADKILTAVDATAYKFNMWGSEEGIEAVGKQLLLGSETTIRIGFRLAEGKTADEYTFTIDGKEAKPVYKDGLYCLEVPNISAHKLDEFHTFTCGGITLEYCALSYVNSMMNKYTEGPSFDLAVAIYNYSQATEAYIAK